MRQKFFSLPPLDWERITDRFIEPIVWVVDNFSDSLGTVCASIYFIHIYLHYILNLSLFTFRYL